jgi:hypothetical protein
LTIGDNRLNFRSGRAPQMPPPSAPVNFLMGTNSNGKHLEEAIRQQILLPGERLLGFFDGIFFDADGQRVGGLALNDYLLVTDRHVTLWARDQFKDFVDHFPLSHAFIRGSDQKDMLHGTLRLGLVPTNVPDAQVAEGEIPQEIPIAFDFVPIADLRQLCDLIEVSGNVHRDMIVGGAGEPDRWKATWMLFNQVFVGIKKSSRPAAPSGYAPAPTPARPVYDPTNHVAPDYEPEVEFVEGDELDDFMTPLSRLDSLDSSRPRPAKSAAQPVAPMPRQDMRNTYGAADSGGDDYDNMTPAEENQDGAEWLLNMVAQNQQGQGQPGLPTAPNGRRVPEMQPEGLYNIGRAGRAAWDGLDKLRREAESRFESRGNVVLPFLHSMRDNGFNLRDITDFVVAVNGLMNTVNHSPAARELLMNFINRSAFANGGGAVPMPPNPFAARRTPEVEDMEDDIPPASTSANEAPRRPARPFGRNNNSPNAPANDPFNPPRYKVSIRNKKEEPEAENEVTGENDDKRTETFFSRADRQPVETVSSANESDDNGGTKRHNRLKVRSAAARLGDNSEN